MTDVHLRARVLLAEAESLGVGLADLVAVGDVSTIPTLATYIETIAPTFAAATAATAATYWRLAIARHGDRPIASLDVGDLHLVVADAIARAKRRRPTTTGRSSAETCVTALRAVFRRATRHDLDPTRSTVWLREKNGSEREQPVAPTTLHLIDAHAVRRGGNGQDDAVFRSKAGHPISRRRYDVIFERARPSMGWADRTPVSAHVLRHTAITAVGRLAGYPVAQAFAGHAASGTTGRYLHASITEVAEAVAALTGERHPLAAGRREHSRLPRCRTR